MGHLFTPYKKKCEIPADLTTGLNNIIIFRFTRDIPADLNTGLNNNIILRFTRCPHLNTKLKMLRTELYTLNCV